MRIKILALTLTICFIVIYFGQLFTSAQTNTVEDLQKLLDDIVVFNLNQSNTDDIPGWLASGAAGSTDFYVMAISQLGEYTDLSGYARNLIEYLNKNHIKNHVTKQKYALALISAGGLYSDFIQTVADTTIDKMGIMSIIYGLHILNNGALSSEYSSDDVVAKLISKQFDDGGWAISGQYSDVDVTAMAVQALAPHYHDSTELSEAIDRAVTFLSISQLADGGFSSYGNENPESSAQVIIALTSLGIDPMSDERFIKEGNTAIDGMMEFLLEDGSFCHKEGEKFNDMATYQAFLAITSVIRLKNGMGSLYLFDKATINADRSFDTVYGFSGYSEEELLNESVQANSDGYKLWVCILTGVITVVLLILCIIKRQKPATYIFVITIAAVIIFITVFTDIQTPEVYYGSVTNKENIVGTVTMQIRCDLLTEYDSEFIPKDGVILPKTEYVIQEGDTAYDILIEAVKINSIHIETTGPKNLVYVNGINHLYEFDYGDLSGWVYKVNGEMVSVGCGQCVLKDGDDIVWSYTLALGIDVD